MTWASDFDFEVERARRLVAKDRKQRWVYRGPNGAAVHEKPVPFKEQVSVRWLPIAQCVVCAQAPAALVNPAIGAL